MFLRTDPNRVRQIVLSLLSIMYLFNIVKSIQITINGSIEISC